MANSSETMTWLINSELKDSVHWGSPDIDSLLPGNDPVIRELLYEITEITRKRDLKMPFKSALLIVLVILLTITGTVAIGNTSDSSNNWEEIYSNNGILGFERSIPREAIKEFKAVAYLNARIEVISEVLKDIPSYPLWMAKCGEAKLLETVNKDIKIYYYESKFPWPICNRGTVVKSETIINPEIGITEIFFEAIKDDEKYPVKDDVVQIVNLKGKYIIEFISRELTKIIYISKTDPGGNIFAAMANIESRFYPVTNIEGLRNRVKLKKYKKLGRESEVYDLVESVVTSPKIIEKMSRRNLKKFVLDLKTVNLVLEDNSYVERIISKKASLESIKLCVIDSCKKIITDERIRKVNRNKRLDRIISIENIFQDKLLSNMILKDRELIALMVNDNDLMNKILTDKEFLNRVLDCSSLAETITGDSKLITRMVRDKKLAKTIVRKLPECKTKKDFRRVIKKYVDSYKTNS